MKYIVEPSAVQSMPFEIPTSVSIVVTVPSGSSRYRLPIVETSSKAIVPAQNRPSGSTLPSFIRVSGSSASTAAMRRVVVAPGSWRWNPSSVARTRPPPWRSPTEPTVRPTSSVTSRPAGDVRWTIPSRMSTHTSSPVSSSQTGPSPSSARASRTSSTPAVVVTSIPLW